MSNTREITAHQVQADEPLRIFAAAPPNPAGAINSYVIGEVDGENITNCLAVVQFQNGHPDEHGRNGVTMEALLAVCMDRLQGFQAGPFANDYNAAALMLLERALEALKDRTREREQIPGILADTAEDAALLSKQRVEKFTEGNA